MHLKNILLLTSLLALAFLGSAQRYKDKVFDSVVVLSNVPYGSAITYKGDTLKLTMDIYMPSKDTAQKRPVLVLAHGGSFVGGTQNSGDMVYLCTDLAKRGYVAASIGYRLGVATVGKSLSVEFSNAGWRASQDGKAAIRFFRKDAATQNIYKIDPYWLFNGGASAGAIMGLQEAFLDTRQELAKTLVDTTVTDGFEGKSGNEGYSSSVRGVINLCGALADVTFMNNNRNVVICSMHGNKDATVPYGTDYYKLLGNNLVLLQGSFSVDSAAQKIGVLSRLYTFLGADHVPFISDTNYMDTTCRYVSKFVYDLMKGNLTGVSSSSAPQVTFAAYPNPVAGLLHWRYDGVQIARANITLTTISGQVVYSANTSANEGEMNTSALPEGMYFLQIQTDQGSKSLKVLVNPWQ